MLKLLIQTSCAVLKRRPPRDNQPQAREVVQVAQNAGVGGGLKRYHSNIKESRVSLSGRMNGEERPQPTLLNRKKKKSQLVAEKKTNKRRKATFIDVFGNFHNRDKGAQ